MGHLPSAFSFLTGICGGAILLLIQINKLSIAMSIDFHDCVPPSGGL